jgi:hypothetical protein
MSERIDWYNLIASERGLPDGWRWYELRAVGPHALIKGSLCNVMFKRGPRKGCENWAKRDRSQDREIVITKQELDARKSQYEAETGHCSRCFGTREELAGMSVAEGKLMRPCSRCKATGKAPEVTP